MMVMLFMVMAAAAMLTVFMMVMLFMVMAAAAMLTMLVMVMLFMVMAAAAMLTMLVMVMFLFQLSQFGCQALLALHGSNQLLAGQIIPGSSDQSSSFIMLSNQSNGGIQLGLRNRIGTGQDDGIGSFDLIIIELTEVLHVNLNLTCIRHSNGITQLHILAGDLFHRCDYIGQFANTGRFDDHSIGMILGDHLGQSLAKVTNQRAANAAGVHLRNVDAGILQKATVNADLTKFIFDQHQLLALIGFLNHLLNQSGFTCAQETGENINNCHKMHLLYIRFHLIVYHCLSRNSRIFP